MRFDVTVSVDVDVDGYATEYAITTAQALREILTDLRHPGQYLVAGKWRGLATVANVKAQLCLFSDLQLAAITKVLDA